MALYPAKDLSIGNSFYYFIISVFNSKCDSILLIISKCIYAFTVIKCLIDDQRACLFIFIVEKNRGSCIVFHRSAYSVFFRVCGNISAVNAYRCCALEVIKICIGFCDRIRSGYHI